MTKAVSCPDLTETRQPRTIDRVISPELLQVLSHVFEEKFVFHPLGAHTKCRGRRTCLPQMSLVENGNRERDPSRAD